MKLCSPIVTRVANSRATAQGWSRKTNLLAQPRLTAFYAALLPDCQLESRHRKLLMRRDGEGRKSPCLQTFYFCCPAP